MAVRRSAAPTLADVAAEAGVSQATASRALADSPLVNENTRRRVWEVAERLRFQPNRLARSLRQGATMAVGLVVPDVGAAFYASALEERPGRPRGGGLPRAGAQHRPRRGARARGAAARCARTRSTGCWWRRRAAMRTSACPAVFFDNVPAQRGAGAVAMDNEGGRAAARGASRAASTATSGSPTWGRRRRSARAPTASCRARAASGWRRSAARSDAPGCRCRPSTCARASRRASRRTRAPRARELMALDRPPTAIIGGSDDARHRPAARAARGRPRASRQDVALVSFDEPVSADLLDPPMTSPGPPRPRARADRGGGAAARAAPATTGRRAPSRVPAALSVRRSCGCDLTEDGGLMQPFSTVCNRLQVPA